MIDGFKIDLGVEQNQILGIEMQCVLFYKHCIRISNLFSTKFVLQKVIEIQKNHMNEIVNSMGNDLSQIRIPDVLADLTEAYLFHGIEKSFSLESLNFVEANQLAIHLVDNYINYYSKIIESESQEHIKSVLTNLIELKQDFRQKLNQEYQRLRYK